MALLLPSRGDVPSFSYKTALAGVVYQLEFNWNMRTESWYMNIRTSNGIPIDMGIRISPGSNYQSNRVFGVFQFIGPSDYSKEDLGGDVQVLFADASEIVSEGETGDPEDTLIVTLP